MGALPERKIGPDVFTVAALPAMRSFILQPRLAPLLGIVIEALAGAQRRGISSLKDLVDHEDDVLALIGPVIGKLSSVLPPVELEAITKELLYGAAMNGRALFTPEGNPFDVVMRGRTMDTWRLLLFALEINYPDFSGALGSIGASGQVAASSEGSPNPSAPPGPAGG